MAKERVEVVTECVGVGPPGTFGTGFSNNLNYMLFSKTMETCRGASACGRLIGVEGVACGKGGGGEPRKVGRRSAGEGITVLFRFAFSRKTGSLAE
jgi:hypothetical protein